MLSPDSKSVFTKVHIWVTLLFFTAVIAITAVVIWSYGQIWQNVKLLVLVAIDLDTTDAQTTLPANIESYLDPYYALSENFRIEINEFELTFNSVVKNFWDATAYPPALALIVSMYIYPYLKLIIYLIVFFIPLKTEYQYRTIFHLNQWNKAMYIPLVAVLIQCSTFSFTIVPPTELLQNATDVNAEAYPGPGLLTNLIVIIFYALTDYALMFIIKSNHKWIISQQITRLKLDGGKSSISRSMARSDIDGRSEFVIKHQIKQRYLSSSYLGIIGKSLFIVMIFINVYLVLEAINTATIRFKLNGVLAKFIEDVYVINSPLETPKILLNTSLLKDATANFIYVTYIIVMIVCPCFVIMSLALVWILPIFNDKLGFEIIPKYIMPIIWWIQSWNAIDIFYVCQFGCSEHNIKYGTKYLLDNKFPAYCGVNGLVTQIFGEDCSWADATFTYGMIILGAVVLFVWISMYYTNKIFGNQLNKNEDEKLNDVSKKMSLNY